MLLMATAVVGILVNRDDGEPAPVPVQRADPVLDLLGWIPATNETRRSFVVWTKDPGGADGTPVAISAADPFLDRLALTPRPHTLGTSNDWRNRFGYGAREVTG